MKTEAKKVKLTKQQVEMELAAYRELDRQSKETQKELKEKKEFLKANVQPGQYGHMCMTIEFQNVKEHIVSAYTREVMKVSDLTEGGSK